MNIVEELNKYNLDEATYEKILKDIDAKLDGDLDIDWGELVDKYNIRCHPDTIRKASASIFGGKFRAYYTQKHNVTEDAALDNKIAEIRKERVKLQTANLERNRLDRQEARQEMYYEYIGSTCKALPLPEFKSVKLENDGNETEYLLTIADIHYGATFDLLNNVYSPEICKERFELLAAYTIDFIKKNNLAKLNILELGDNIQGILRINDIKINDSSIVKATVEVSRLIALFLNEISEYCYIDYYHVPSANHTQMRNLGTKANELADEDLEYIIGHYIKDLCSANNRINVRLAEDGRQYLSFDIKGYSIISGHGHTLKGYKNSLKNLSILDGTFYDYCIVGHYHGGDMLTSHEGITNDCEVIVAPSFIGSDPYSQSIMKGSKASCLMLGFNDYNGHVETHKFILN